MITALFVILGVLAATIWDILWGSPLMHLDDWATARRNRKWWKKEMERRDASPLYDDHGVLQVDIFRPEERFLMRLKRKK